MSDTLTLIALFQDSIKTARAIDDLHTLGVQDEKMTIITGVPYPEGALGRHREWLTLPYIVLAGAGGGLLFGLFLAAITPHLYRLDVGGHPAVGFPPTAIIIFIFTMMAIIVSTFLGVLWEMNFPRFGPAPYHKLVTHGFLAVLLEFPTTLEDNVRQVFESHNAHYIGEPERLSL
jgi:hypothetical protein